MKKNLKLVPILAASILKENLVASFMIYLTTSAVAPALAMAAKNQVQNIAASEIQRIWRGHQVRNQSAEPIDGLAIPHLPSVASVVDVASVYCGFLGPEDSINFSLTCRNFNKGHTSLSTKAAARAELKAILGPLIKLAPGRFENINHDYDGETKRSIESTAEMLMQKTTVTQAQYDYVMGVGSAAVKMAKYVGFHKPMGGLTYAEWQTYIGRVNAEVARLWLIAYPGEARIPIVDLPTEAELKYAMTEPTTTTILPDGTQATGELREHAGTNATDDATLFQYAVFNQAEPSDVGTKLPHRKFFDLNGNIWQLTKSESKVDGGSLLYILAGGCWSDSRKYCRATSRVMYRPTDACKRVGVRLVLK